MFNDGENFLFQAEFFLTGFYIIHPRFDKDSEEKLESETSHPFCSPRCLITILQLYFCYATIYIYIILSRSLVMAENRR